MVVPFRTAVLTHSRFLNAFWTSFGEQQAEKIWDYCHKCADLDLEKKAEGCELDELNAHR